MGEIESERGQLYKGVLSKWQMPHVSSVQQGDFEVSILHVTDEHMQNCSMLFLAGCVLVHVSQHGGVRIA